MNQLSKVLKLRAGEGPRVSLLALQYFCVVAVTIAGKTTRDTYFLSRFDRSYLPLMFVVCAGFVALVSSLYARAAGKLERSTLTNLSYALFIAVLLLLQIEMSGAAVPVLYVWMEVVLSITTLQFWLQAADSFDPRQAKRLFGLIGGGGSLAAVIVGMGLKPFVRVFGSGSLLLLVCAGLAASWLFGRLAAKYQIVASSSRKSSRPAPPAKLDRYLIYIAIIVGLSAAVTQIVDYQFKISAGTAIPNEGELAAFFGRFYATTGIASLMMQLFVTPMVLGRFGLRAGLLTLPALLGLSATGFLFNPGLLIASLAKFSDQTFKFTLNNSSLELLWLPVSPDRRRVLKPVVGGALKAGAEATAGLLMYFLVKLFDFRFLSALSMAAAAVWLVFCFRLALLYVRELGSAIERRQVDMTGLDIDAQDPSFTRTIAGELEHPDVLRRLFALELIEGLPLEPWAKRLRQMLTSGTPEERDRVLEIARNDEEILPDSLLSELVDQPGEISGRAIPIVAARSLRGCIPSLRQRLLDDDDVTRARAAAAILHLSGADEPAVKAELARIVREGSGEAQAIAVSELRDDLTNLPADALQAVFKEGSPEGRISAASVAAQRADIGSIPALLSQLADARTADAAKEALQTFPPAQVFDKLQAILFATPPAPQRAGVLRSLPDLPVPNAGNVLTAVLPQLRPSETRVAALALLALARRGALSPAEVPEIDACARRLTRDSYRCVRIRHLLPEEPATTLLRDYYESQLRNAVPVLLLLGCTSSPQAPVEQLIRVYESADLSRLPFVLEFIDSSFSIEQRAHYIPQLEQASWADKDAAGRKLFNDLPETLEVAFETALESPDVWESHIVRHYLAQSQNKLEAGGVDLDAGMFSTLEKTILLKSVSLFQNIPAEKLSRVAAIAEERQMPAGTLILREGDFGESLFVVASGSVRVHRAEKELTVFRRGDCLGEMAVLDSAPRSASATALEDTTLLEIDQPSLYQVMESHPEIMQEVIRLLTRRLREANDRIMAQK